MSIVDYCDVDKMSIVVIHGMVKDLGYATEAFYFLPAIREINAVR